MTKMNIFPEILMMVRKFDAVESLLSLQNKIHKEGIIDEEDALPMPVLDITSHDLQSTKEYLTCDAYEDMCLIVNYSDKVCCFNVVKSKQLSWQCKGCNRCQSKQNMIACDKCEHWYHW